LVLGRNCGSCTACCTVKAIAAPGLIKAPGITCGHCDKTGCTVYESRPSVCRDYFCGYIATDWLSDRQRPDRSGVMIDLDAEPAHEGYERAVTVHVFKEAARVLASPFPELIGALIDGGQAVFLSRPGPPGSMNALMLLNPNLAAAADAGDVAGIHAGLSAALATLDGHAFVPFSEAEARARV
jgi:hypothetical protein